MELTGIIKFISPRKSRVKMDKTYYKKMVVLQQHSRHLSYIEFRGDLLNTLNAYNVGDNVKVNIGVQAVTSDGNYINNLIATDIK